MTLIAARPAVTRSTICLRFDSYHTAFTLGLPILKARGLAASVSVIPELIDVVNGQGYSRSELYQFMDAGIEAMAYSNVDMLTLYNTTPYPDGLTLARNRMTTIRSVMAGKDIFPKTLVAESRAWSINLAYLAQGIFDNVLVTNSFEFQQWAGMNRLYLNDGGRAVLDGTTTASEFSLWLNSLEASGGIGFPGTHEVGVSGISVAVLTEIADDLKGRQDAGRIRVCTVNDAMTPVYI